jgi:hypothetical protein
MSSFHWRTSPRDSTADGEDLSGRAIYDAAYHLCHIIIMTGTLT